MKKKRILITGGCGYIGSCLYTVLRKKYDVFVLNSPAHVSTLKKLGKILNFFLNL